MKNYYFGALSKEQLGHYLYGPDNRKAYNHKLPFSEYILDCRLLDPNNNQKAGFVVNYVNGFTILSTWDRSADSRPGSCSNFLFEGHFTLQEAKELAHEYFNQIYLRVVDYLRQSGIVAA